MKRIKRLVIVFAAFLLIPINVVSARRGCCSWHGGVSSSCRNGMIVCNDGTTSPSCGCEGGSTNNSNSNYNNYYKSTPSYTYGCTDSNSINYNPSANKDDGSCIKKVYGCTNSEAVNYNSNANTDDGSCKSRIYGCTHNSAINYNADANTDDKSCQYSKTKTSYEKIDYKIKYRYNLLNREGKVIQKGVYGKRKILIEYVIDEDNNIISSKIISKKIVKKPIIKIISTKDKKKNNKFKSLKNTQKVK